MSAIACPSVVRIAVGCFAVACFAVACSGEDEGSSEQASLDNTPTARPSATDGSQPADSPSNTTPGVNPATPQPEDPSNPAQPNVPVTQPGSTSTTSTPGQPSPGTPDLNGDAGSESGIGGGATQVPISGPNNGGSGVGGSGVAGSGDTPAPVNPSGGSSGTGAPVEPDPSCGSHKWACWPMPNPAGSGLPNEASYTDNADGTVTDDVTGLQWQAEAPGDNFEWQAGIDHCEALDLGGFDDWRLPTRVELMSVMDFNRNGAKFPAEAFPGAAGGFHKTASDWILTINQQGAGAGTDFAWAFNMSDGIVSNAYSKATAARIRCVRGNGEGEAPSEPAVAPPDQYTALSDDEVLDNYTGLVWQRGYSSELLSWESAVSYCADLGGGGVYRLPSIRELGTLVDEALVAPSINREMFPDTQYGSRSNNWYWASHQAVGSSAAWALNFDDGFTGFNAGADGAWNHWTAAWAKCVR